MSARIPRLEGEEWQRWANKLLTCRYGPTEYQTVPDNHNGDAGIEGFTVTDGHVYQAYGCEEPLSTQQRYEAQRTKMSDDIKKFIDNAAVLKKLFGTVKIRRWVLFVPYFDSKEIVAHASKKTQEILDAKLVYVAKGFRVMVCQEDDYAAERNTLTSANLHTLQVEVDKSTTEQATSWSSSNHNLSSTLESKIRKLPTIKNDEHRHQFHQQVLKWYLDGQSIHEALRKYPEVYENVLKAKNHRENFLAMTLISGDPPQNIINTTMDELKNTLRSENKMLGNLEVESLAHEAVADWLLRCPLDFPEIHNNA
jgi:hypothetical protein